MTAVRKRTQAHRQPEPEKLVHEFAAAGWQPVLMEMSQPAGAGQAGAWHSPAVNGGALGSAVAIAIYGLGSLLKMSPAEIASWCSFAGGGAAFLGMVFLPAIQGQPERAVIHWEFETGNGHQPAGEPLRDARFVRPDPETMRAVALPGDWTAERLQAFARRLMNHDYDLTVRAHVPDFCSYEQLKVLLAWLEEHELVQVTDGRGTKAVRARGRRIIERWAAGHIDAL